MRKKEIRRAINFLPLSQIENPAALVNDPGDKFSLEVTKSGKKVMKLHTKGIKRAIVQHKKGGGFVETIAYQ